MSQKKMPPVDVSRKIMSEINSRKIKMKSRALIIAEKIGMESFLALCILGGALAFSIFLYFLKKTSLLKFLFFGWPGIKIFLQTLPYDYIALFLITFLAANYLIHKMDFSVNRIVPANLVLLLLFLATIFIGSFFALIGAEQLLKGWSNNKLPRQNAVWGRVINISENKLKIESEDGTITEIIFERSNQFPYAPDFARNRFLRAVGNRDRDDDNIFHAEMIQCCD